MNYEERKTQNETPLIADYKLLDEMYQDDYYPVFLVDKVKDELQKVIDLSGERRNRHRSGVRI